MRYSLESIESAQAAVRYNEFGNYFIEIIAITPNELNGTGPVVITV